MAPEHLASYQPQPYPQPYQCRCSVEDWIHIDFVLAWPVSKIDTDEKSEDEAKVVMKLKSPKVVG